jgi:NADPH:quinone reductase
MSGIPSARQMYAAVIEAVSTEPVLRVVDRPAVADGEVLIKVSAAGLNPHDLVVAGGVRGAPPVPYFPGNEGVGRLEDGTRVYFGPTTLAHGTMAQYSAIDRSLVIEIPDELSDAYALGIGVAGTTAWLALDWKARLQPGESVLVLGATGAVGQIAVQAAKLLGASRVVAAGRDRATLDLLLQRGADEVIVLDEGYEQRLVDRAQGGFALVVDSLYGAPMVAALHATKYGGRLVNLGMRAGRLVELPGLALKGRDLLTYNGDLPPRETMRAAYQRMVAHVVAGELIVNAELLPLPDIASAWKRQQDSPNTKLVLIP